MSERRSPPEPARPRRDDAPSPSAREFPELTVGPRRLGDYALRRLKASRPLQVCMTVAFLCYGALVFLVVSGRVAFPSAGIVALLSLASWFFLFWWYPVLERTREALAGDARREWIPSLLEGLAVLCVVVVHVLMLLIVLLQ